MSRWKGSLKSLEKTLTLSAQITQIDTIINMLTKRKLNPMISISKDSIIF